MSIEPFIACRDILKSLRFYTQVLDFHVIVAPDSDPDAFMSKYALLEREGSWVHLSAHSGDGKFGNTVYVRVENADKLWEQFIVNGLKPDSTDILPGVAIKPVDQSWGMREFTLKDPDGNRITFGHSLT